MSRSARRKKSVEKFSALKIRVSCTCSEICVPLSQIRVAQKCNAGHTLTIGPQQKPHNLQMIRVLNGLYSALKKHGTPWRWSDEFLTDFTQNLVITKVGMPKGNYKTEDLDQIVYWLIRENSRAIVERKIHLELSNLWLKLMVEGTPIWHLLDLGPILPDLEMEFSDQADLISCLSGVVHQVSESDWKLMLPSTVANPVPTYGRMVQLQGFLASRTTRECVDLLNRILAIKVRVDFDKDLDQYRYDPNAYLLKFSLAGWATPVTIRVRDQRSGRYLGKEFD